MTSRSPAASMSSFAARYDADGAAQAHNALCDGPPRRDVRARGWRALRLLRCRVRLRDLQRGSWRRPRAAVTASTSRRDARNWRAAAAAAWRVGLTLGDDDKRRATGCRPKVDRVCCGAAGARLIVEPLGRVVSRISNRVTGQAAPGILDGPSDGDWMESAARRPRLLRTPVSHARSGSASRPLCGVLSRPLAAILNAADAGWSLERIVEAESHRKRCRTVARSLPGARRTPPIHRVREQPRRLRFNTIFPPRSAPASIVAERRGPSAAPLLEPLERTEAAARDRSESPRKLERRVAVGAGEADLLPVILRHVEAVHPSKQPGMHDPPPGLISRQAGRRGRRVATAYVTRSIEDFRRIAAVSWAFAVERAGERGGWRRRTELVSAMWISSAPCSAGTSAQPMARSRRAERRRSDRLAAQRTPR